MRCAPPWGVGVVFYIALMMPLAFSVLRKLADAQFHSGAALARAFGVSRGTVWNAVRELDAAGLVVHRVRGRGYRLPQPVSLLEREAVLMSAGAAASRLQIEILDTAESTNTLLMQRAAGAAASGTVIAAEWQQSGRGRMGRPWHAGLAGAVTFSLLWRFSQGANALAGLSLAAGVAVVRALARLGAADAQLKWPNDVVWRGGKLAGVLIEMQGDALGPSVAVLGIGLNVRLTQDLRSRIDQPVADLEAACGHAIDRSAVLGIVLAELAAILDAFSREGFSPLREEWERNHAHQGRRVTVRLPGGQAEEGIACGVAADGALLFDGGSGVRRLLTGEVSLREAGAAPAVVAAQAEGSRT